MKNATLKISNIYSNMIKNGKTIYIDNIYYFIFYT